MKIGIDVLPLYNQSQFRGIGFYIKRLIEALKKEKEIELVEIKDRKIPNEIDLIHYPYFSPFFISLPLFSRKKFIVTIHDLIPLVFPKAYPSGIRGKIKFEIQKVLLKRASRIITDSENSKKDIIKFLKIPEERIDIVFLAPGNNVKRIENKEFLAKLSNKFNLPKRFVLYVGDVNFNKNVIGIVKACRMVKIPLVIVGKQAVQSDFDADNIENRSLAELISLTEGKKDIIKLGFLEEDELSGLYSLASVYCQPSFYEGFGLQILEAMTCGCPVVTSNISSLPEVAGKAALLVNPESTEEIAEGIRKMIEDKEFREKMVSAGFKQASKFGWEKTARETIKAYEKALAK